MTIKTNEETRNIKTCQTTEVKLFQENGKWVCEQQESQRRGGYRVIARCVNDNKEKCFQEMFEIVKETHEGFSVWDI